MKRLDTANLRVDPKKIQSGKSEVNVLSFIVSKNSVKLNPNKISSVLEMPSPTNKKELQQILNLSGYYRKFIPNYAEKAAILTDLLKKDTSWNWPTDHEKALREINDELLKEPILKLPNPNLPYVLYTNASNRSIGGILGQINENGNKRIVAFASRKLQAAEINYATTHKEELAEV